MTEADYQKLKAQIEALERRLFELEARPQATPLWVERIPAASPFVWPVLPARLTPVGAGDGNTYVVG